MRNITSMATFPPILAAMIFASMIASQTCQAQAADDRTLITLEHSEREVLLAGMRTYLQSVQGIVAALAENRNAEVAEIAAKSGAKLLQSASPLTAAKLPLGFMSMSFDTHDKFDRLAAKSKKSASRTQILTDLRDILANCTSCHMSFRLVNPK